MRVVYQSAIAGYLKKYSRTFERKLGMSDDDIVSEIREQIWKGLATYDPSRRANKKTYLNNIIKNRFGVLLERCDRHKHNALEYSDNVYILEGVDSRHFETEENPEDNAVEKQLLEEISLNLSSFDLSVNSDLEDGMTVQQIAKRHGKSQVVVKASVNRLLKFKDHIRSGKWEEKEK